MNGLSKKHYELVLRIDNRVKEYGETPEETEALLLSLHQNLTDFKALISTLPKETIEEIAACYSGFARFKDMVNLVYLGLTKLTTTPKEEAYQ